MGRYDLNPLRVHHTASQLLQAKRIPVPPPWYNAVGTIPPPQRLNRPVMHRPKKLGKKASRLFQPIRLKYTDDSLRWEYFNDHPWELAKPRVILENDGRDREKYDWSVPLDHSLHRPLAGEKDAEGVELDREWERIQDRACVRPLNGEAVVQRHAYLLSTGMPYSLAYDTARKELYRMRHYLETEARVAREEARAVGAVFDMSPLEIGMKLEDEAYEDWKLWAQKETRALKQLQGSTYTGLEAEESVEIEELNPEALLEASDADDALHERV